MNHSSGGLVFVSPALPRETLYWTALIWILVTIAGLLASAPIAWRTLMEGVDPTRKESIVMAWVAVMAILSIPAFVILEYVRSETRHQKEVSLWRFEDLSSD